ncbi:MAG: hypothetical protein ACU841_14455 [Gammaproteobacteria bacterium]
MKKPVPPPQFDVGDILSKDLAKNNFAFCPGTYPVRNAVSLSVGLGGSILAADILTRYAPGLLPSRDVIDGRSLSLIKTEELD